MNNRNTQMPSFWKRNDKNRNFVLLKKKGTTKMITLLLLRKVTAKNLIQKYVQKQNKRNYVQTVKRDKLLNESQVRKTYLPPPKFPYQSLGVAAGRRTPG